ncbi:MAG: amino acid-binding protein [Candidatus Methanomethylophilaceae archaeon]|nr:amino acid-binding protein [Candidatus Methanomethylophilaceae archaeon]
MSEIITQLSIFVNNEPGRLAAIASTLRECDVSMKAFSLAESVEFGILRAIVQNPEQAYEKLRSKGIVMKKTEVIGIRLPDRPGAIFETANVLGGAGINIEYGYAYTGDNGPMMFLRVDDPRAAVEALSASGVKTLKESEI